MTKKRWKGFDPDFCCRGKQYEEGQTYEEEGNEICEAGVMHYCENPFDVWNYYGPVADDGRLNTFAEVEPLADEIRRDDKCATTKLRITARLSFANFIKAAVDFVMEKTRDATLTDNGEKQKQIGSSGYGAQIGSSGDWAKIGSSGYRAKIGSSGDWAKIGSSGYGAQIGSSGDGAQIGSSGDWAKIGSSGDWAKIGSSGDWAKIGSSGDGAQIGSSGDWAKIGSSGDGAQIGSSGDWAKIGSSGYGAKIVSEGEGCVICCAGHNCTISAKKGSWITLAEWKEWKERWIPYCVKTFFVDGEVVKENTVYRLEDGELKEVEK